MRKSFKDTPVLDISLRKFEKPSGDHDELLHKFCISIGLLQPGDSRDIIVDLLKLFLKARKVKRFMPVEQVYKYILDAQKPGASQSNIRRHLHRLKELEFVEKTGQGYRLREWLSLQELVKEFVKFKVEPTINRLIEYASVIDVNA